MRWFKKPKRKQAQAVTKKRRNFEDEEQRKFFRWFGFYYPEHRRLCWHNANGGLRNKLTGYFLKLLGVKPGVPDITLAVPTPNHHGLYIEMKRCKKDGPSQISIDQKETIRDLNKMGYLAVVCYGFGEAMEITKEYLQCR